MKKKIYGCDGGCIMIGNGSFRVHIPNGIGDGDHFVYVYSKGEKFDLGSKTWMCSIEGTDIFVYRYDCLSKEELFQPKNLVLMLSGRYGVYADRGSVHLVER